MNTDYRYGRKEGGPISLNSHEKVNLERAEAGEDIEITVFHTLYTPSVPYNSVAIYKSLMKLKEC